VCAACRGGCPDLRVCQLRCAPVWLYLSRVAQVYNVVCVSLAVYVVYGVLEYKLVKPGSFACNKLDATAAGRKLSRVLWHAPPACCACAAAHARAQGVLRPEVPGVWRHALLRAPQVLPSAHGAAPLPPRLNHPRGACPCAPGRSACAESARRRPHFCGTT
jgi:hypothetical protein